MRNSTSTSLLINVHSNLTIMGFISDVIVSHESNLGGYEFHLGCYEFLEVCAGSKWDWTKQDQSEKA